MSDHAVLSCGCIVRKAHKGPCPAPVPAEAPPTDKEFEEVLAATFPAHTSESMRHRAALLGLFRRQKAAIESLRTTGKAQPATPTGEKNG